MKSKRQQPSAQDTTTSSSASGSASGAPPMAAGMSFSQGQAMMSPGASGPASTGAMSGKVMLKRGNNDGKGRRGNAKQTFGAATAAGGSKVPHQAAMEQAFGQSFAGVQAFTSKKDEMQSLGANAAQHGEKVAFADSSPSKELVAHELAHVVQARGGDTGSGDLSKPGDRQEVQADQAAAAVMQGGSAKDAGLGGAAPGKAPEQGPVHGSFLGDVFESTKSNLLGMDTAVDAKRWFETSVLYRAAWLQTTREARSAHIDVVIDDNLDWRVRWLEAAGPVVTNQSDQLLEMMAELKDKAGYYNDLQGRTSRLMRNANYNFGDQDEDEEQARPQTDIADMTMLRAELKDCNAALRHQRNSFEAFTDRADALGLGRLGDGFAEKADRKLQASQAARHELVAQMEQQGASLDTINAASSQDLAHASRSMRRMEGLGSTLDEWWDEGECLMFSLQAYLADPDVSIDRATRRHYQGLIAAVSGVNAKIEPFGVQISGTRGGLDDHVYRLAEDADTDSIEWLPRALAAIRDFKPKVGALNGLLERYDRQYKSPYEPFRTIRGSVGAADRIVRDL